MVFSYGRMFRRYLVFEVVKREEFVFRESLLRD